MATIQIRNVGPLSDTGMIELKSFNLIIGRQSSGKSTFLKILSYCRWLDKRAATGVRIADKSISYAYGHYSRFIKDLMKFYRFDSSFFNENSEIFYEGDTISISFRGNIKRNATILPYAQPDRYNSKLCFIPSERNLVSAVKNIEASYRSSEYDLLFNFIFEWSEAREKFSAENKLSLAIAPNMEYYYDKDNGERLCMTDKKNIAPFNPFYASSGIQSALPVEVLTHTVLNSIGKQASMSKKDIYDIINHVVRQNNIFELLDVANDGNKLKKQLMQYQAGQLFIEEPEQNLFPSSQTALLRKIITLLKKRIIIRGQKKVWLQSPPIAHIFYQN